MLPFQSNFTSKEKPAERSENSTFIPSCYISCLDVCFTVLKVKFLEGLELLFAGCSQDSRFFISVLRLLCICQQGISRLLQSDHRTCVFEPDRGEHSRQQGTHILYMYYIVHVELHVQ